MYIFMIFVNYICMKKNIKNLINNFFNNNDNYVFSLNNKKENSFISNESQMNNNDVNDVNVIKKQNNQEVYPNIDVNLEYINSRFNTLINSDVKIREFIINVKSRQFKAFIIYIDGMVNKDSINDFILRPLMLKNYANQYNDNDIISEAIATNILVRKIKKFNIEDYISDHLLPQNDIEKVSSFDKIIYDVSSGNCALFVDTINYVFDIDVKSFDKRSIAKPENELSIMGSQEAFVENLRTNTSMIRRNLCNENLIIENLSIGKTDKNSCSICYLKNLANSDLVAEVKFRLNNLDVEYLNSMGELKELIKDDMHTTLPEIISTERVDRATTLLLEGRVVVIYNGSPYVMVMPATIFDFLTTPEDLNVNFIFANFLKIIRAISYFITLLLPGLYVAITTYHGELIPTELLYSIISSRENVPFILIVEITLMELSFEIIREAGLRVPSPLGPTVGIVGALVLGQAAVQANIVSPFLIIIIAITGITSFSIPNYSLSFHLRLNRFIYIILGAVSGFFGIGIGLFLYLLTLCSLKSFGVPYLAPYAPFAKIHSNGYFLKPAWKRENRSSFLDPKDTKIQNNKSMKWRI